MSFGDLRWAALRGGELTGRERLGQLWEVVRFRLTQRLRRRPRALGAVGPAEVERMMAEVELPKSPLVDRAAALVHELGPAALAAHALRTWAWGTLLGLRDGLRWNKEELALAALLHDLALVRRSPTPACFAADGARQAVGFLEDWGAGGELSARVGDAICLHLRVTVPVELGVEAHLVHDGASVDVIGSGLSGLHPELRRRVLLRHPRLDLKSFLTEVLTREHQQHPHSRIGRLVSLGFVDRVRNAPFES